MFVGFFFSFVFKLCPWHDVFGSIFHLSLFSLSVSLYSILYIFTMTQALKFDYVGNVHFMNFIWQVWWKILFSTFLFTNAENRFNFTFANDKNHTCIVFLLFVFRIPCWCWCWYSLSVSFYFSPSLPPSSLRLRSNIRAIRF